jgi:hypothetical protein
VAEQEKDIPTQIVAVDELLLQELILLGGERARESLRLAGDILATDQVRELRKLVRPCQFGADGAQSDEAVDIGGGDERWRLRVQTGHPAEEMGLTAQLIERVHRRVSGPKIAQEVVYGPAVVANGVRAERCTEGINRAIEDGG